MKGEHIQDISQWVMKAWLDKPYSLTSVVCWYIILHQGLIIFSHFFSYLFPFLTLMFGSSLFSTLSTSALFQVFIFSLFDVMVHDFHNLIIYVYIKNILKQYNTIKRHILCIILDVILQNQVWYYAEYLRTLGSQLEFNIKLCGFQQNLAEQHDFVMTSV